MPQNWYQIMHIWTLIVLHTDLKLGKLIVQIYEKWGKNNDDMVWKGERKKIGKRLLRASNLQPLAFESAVDPLSHQGRYMDEM